MYIPRTAAATASMLAEGYPVVTITGPRQSGKTTLAKKVFVTKPYCSLEDMDQRSFAQDDPRGFLAQYPDGAILDEVQHCPELFSYIQTLVDDEDRMGLFILSGSQQFGLLSSISQSLAGRTGIIHLLPFSLAELQHVEKAHKDLNTTLYAGAYPPIYDRAVAPKHWYADYLTTYVERDVRQLINVQNLNIFQRFLKMCAGRIGQLLNLSGLANDCGITHNTAKAWLSVLETSYIVFLLPPHHVNFNKRLVKTPKLYFYDTGLAAWLLGLREPKQMTSHAMRGGLFESWVIAEIYKQAYHQGERPSLFFWRDNTGHEIDLVIEQGVTLCPIEIKSGQTISGDYFKGLHFWLELANKKNTSIYSPKVIYGGNKSQSRSDIRVLSWRDIAEDLLY